MTTFKKSHISAMHYLAAEFYQSPESL